MSTKPKMEKFIEEHKSTILLWGPVTVTTLFVFFLMSDRDFSFLMTFSSLISFFSFLMVAIKIESSKSVAGVSLTMIDCYLLITGARLFAIVPFEGYLPYDRSGDWLYQLIETFIFLTVGTIVYLCRKRYNNTYQRENDTFPHHWIVGPAVILAFIFHPSLNGFWPSDVAWVFALYLEAAAALPQLFLFQKEGSVKEWTAHFLFAQVISKIASFIFWYSSFNELGEHDRGHKAYVGYWVLGMQCMQLLVMCDFIYNYIKCISRGVPVAQMLNVVDSV